VRIKLDASTLCRENPGGMKTQHCRFEGQSSLGSLKAPETEGEDPGGDVC